MTAMVWLRALRLPLPLAVMCSLKNTRGKSKTKLYMCARRPLVSDPKGARK